MQVIDHAERGHCELSPSAAKRWMACPGSIALSRGVDRITTYHAAEGTAAHEVAECCLRLDVEPAVYLGLEMHGFVVDEEMVEAVQVYVDHCREIRAVCAQTWVEQRVSLARLNPPANMWGTADHVGVSTAVAGKRTLYVSDLKYGKGVEVSAEGNVQLLYYGLGAYIVSPHRDEIGDVVLTIVQPRTGMDPVKSVTYSTADLVDFSVELLAAADAALEDDAPRFAGEHCRFCPAAAICPEKRSEMEALARVEFSRPAVAPPEPAELTLHQLQTVLSRKSEIVAWLRSVEDYAKARMQGGGEIPGMKLVATRPRRMWAKSSEETERQLRKRGVRVRDLFSPRELRSPAQVEKYSGKSIPDELVMRVSSGLTLAPLDDPRPAAVLGAGEEFAAIPGPDDPFE